MCFNSFPAPGSSVVFGQLNLGDEVKIAVGYGHPQTEDEVLEIIVSIDGFSGLTNTGRKLSCFDASGFEPTGNHLDDYEVHPEAQKILDEIYGSEEPTEI